MEESIFYIVKLLLLLLLGEGENAFGGLRFLKVIEFLLLDNGLVVVKLMLCLSTFFFSFYGANKLVKTNCFSTSSLSVTILLISFSNLFSSIFPSSGVSISLTLASSTATHL